MFSDCDRLHIYLDHETQDLAMSIRLLSPDLRQKKLRQLADMIAEIAAAANGTPDECQVLDRLDRTTQQVWAIIRSAETSESTSNIS